MNKSKRNLKISVVAFLFSVASLATVSAAGSTFSDFSIPKFQNWAVLGLYRNSKTTDHGTVKLSSLGPAAVTFKARARQTDGSWASFGASTVVSTTGDKLTVKYANSYGARTFIQVQVRNHNWTASSKKISGTWYVDGA